MKSQLIDSMRQEDALTANGAITHSTSLNACLDLFFIAGASRRMNAYDIIQMFEMARSENKDLAYKILFWARDCRGGAGEKRFFQIVGNHVARSYPVEWSQLSIFIPEYGYWKDFFKIEKPNEDNLNFFKFQLEENPNKNLLAKWFPRKGKWFVAMHKYLGLTPKEFRKKLVGMTNVVESKMCAKRWDSIEYSTVPSYAMNMYRNSFMSHDSARFNGYIADVLDGKTKINSSVLFPHQLVQAIHKGEDANAVEAQWRALPNFMEGSKERILPVCDVSGSMTGLPMDVAIALGMYISERNEGIFKDAFMTFSESPKMQYVLGSSLRSRLISVKSADWGMNTDLQETFRVLLEKALDNDVPEDQMPTKLLIISDMEFDEACEGTNLKSIRKMYRRSGYTLPEIIFWNVNGRQGNVPAKADDPGVGLVSGFSPSILTAILAGEGFTPVDLMMKAVGGERYAKIKVWEEDIL